MFGLLKKSVGSYVNDVNSPNSTAPVLYKRIMGVNVPLPAVMAEKVLNSGEEIANKTGMDMGSIAGNIAAQASSNIATIKNDMLKDEALKKYIPIGLGLAALLGVGLFALNNKKRYKR